VQADKSGIFERVRVGDGRSPAVCRRKDRKKNVEQVELEQIRCGETAVTRESVRQSGHLRVDAEGVLREETGPFGRIRCTPVAVAERVNLIMRLCKVEEIAGIIPVERTVEIVVTGKARDGGEKREIPFGVAGGVERPLRLASVRTAEVREDAAVDCESFGQPAAQGGLGNDSGPP